MTMRLPEALKRSADQYPHKVALHFKQHSISYASLSQQSDALASSLLNLGVMPGDRIGVLADPGIEPVVIFWASLKVGAIAVFFNEHLQADGLQEILTDCQPTLLFSSQRYAEKKLAQLSIMQAIKLQLLETDYPMLIDNAGILPTVDGLTSQDIATIVYTSGSTGKPKGVCLSHRGLLLVAQADSQQMQISAQDIYLMLVPLHYVHGILQLLIHLLNGASIHFAGSFLFPRNIVKQLVDIEATGCSGVPFHLIALLDRAGFLDTALPNLRWLAVTGGKLASERIQQIRQAQPHVNIYITYGQTECSPRITSLSADKIDIKPDSVGAAPAGISVCVVSDDAQVLPTGEIGEVLVKGDNLMVGYWQDSIATENVIDENGWLHTGDLAWFDTDGDLFLAGRKQAMIKSGGERIFPEELERVIAGHDDVAEVAVIGVPDPLYGQRVEAHIQVLVQQQALESQALQDMIRGYCLERIPFARAPKAYHFWDELPRKANGKIDRQQLLASSNAVKG